MRPAQLIRHKQAIEFEARDVEHTILYTRKGNPRCIDRRHINPVQSCDRSLSSSPSLQPPASRGSES